MSVSSPSTSNFSEHFSALCSELGLCPSEKQWQKIHAFLKMLVETNRKINLVGTNDFNTLLARHAADSLAGVSFLPRSCKIIDVGTGGGFPGLILKLWEPELEITLVDATRKKVRFLEDVIRKMNLPGITPVWNRAEALQRKKAFSEKYDCACSRAAGSVENMIALLTPFIRDSGQLLLYAGTSACEREKEIRKKSRSCGWNKLEYIPYKIRSNSGIIIRAER